jgi:hypothetical protein
MPRKMTGLRHKNQKKLSKAIKRCQAMGLMPYTYKIKDEEYNKPTRRKIAF